MRNKTKILSVGLTAAITVGGGLSACKLVGSKASKEKSIDAVETGNQVLRSNLACGPGTLANASVSDAVIRSYAALPPFLQMQFSDLSASFRISENPAQDCMKFFKAMPSASMSPSDQALQQDSRLQALKACWVAPAVAAGVVQSPQVIMGNVVQDVHNTMQVTSFYAFAEWYIDRIAGTAIDGFGATEGKDLGAKGHDLIDFVSKFRDARKAIAGAVLADLTAADKKDVIAKYEQDFAAPGASLSANVAFQNFVSAEFTDTWYCNVETHQSLVNSQVFPKAREAYTGMAKILGKAWFEE